MALPAEDILQDFFETSVLGEVSREQLQRVTEEYPFYGTAHFLLSKKLYDSKETGSGQALQKAALHFPNELLLHFNLNYSEEAGEVIVTAPEAEEINNSPEAETQPFTEDLPEAAIPFSEITEDITLNDKFSSEIPAQPELASDASPAEIEPAEIGDVIIQDKLSNLLQEQAAAFEKPVEVAAEISVEITAPHRIDYFESQGIKLEDEKNDKLSTQLKRFTDWLKQMKRINPNPTELKSDEAGEHEVQHKAEHSNEPEEIVTETMAEVLIKQGKPEQAINIYEKLSFINPSKSAYFAAKIGELKS